ncbi:MAG TPA: tetratricopeptide repeat protein, partial [Candidatus Kryptobacter bacterium]|nr:tetratricopeptide repeat protein [Candidatus Kryptobacter bacterium]
KEAKDLLDELLASNPTNSEYHRVYGQILSMEGNQDEAINQLIDALRWDPKNTWALIMMGNIFGRSRSDIDTASKYFEQALKVDQDNFIAMNNIGATLMEARRYEDARKFFERAIAVNKTYPNTHFGLSMLEEAEGHLDAAFEHAVQTMKLCKEPDEVYQNALNQATALAKQIIGTGTGSAVIHSYLRDLYGKLHKTISLVPDSAIPAPAKLELAENYNRDEHVIRYKPNYPAVEYLQMHELVTLLLTAEAREASVFKLFISTGKQKADFIRELGQTINKLKKSGYSEESISAFCSALFDGLNRQVYNTPFELFIHGYVYEKFPELRPHEFLSLFAINTDALRSVTDKKIAESTPPHILWKSKLYNMLIAFKLRELYGVDTLKEYKAKGSELQLAEGMYRDHLEVMQHHKPGDEFRLVEKWAKALDLENNFTLVDENEYRNAAKMRVDVASALEQSTVNQSKKESEAEKFQDSQKKVGTNMAVVMYMVAALQYFKDIPADRVKMIATQIALMGAHGIDPNREGYKVDLIPDKEFTGHQLLAYYYVSWALSNPKMLSQLGLPYEKEYELAHRISDRE